MRKCNFRRKAERRALRTRQRNLKAKQNWLEKSDAETERKAQQIRLYNILNRVKPVK